MLNDADRRWLANGLRAIGEGENFEEATGLTRAASRPPSNAGQEIVEYVATSMTGGLGTPPIKKAEAIADAAKHFYKSEGYVENLYKKHKDVRKHVKSRGAVDEWMNHQEGDKKSGS